MKKLLNFLILGIFCCYLGLHNGYLAIWNDQDPNPVYVFPYKAEYYPGADRKALQHGIPITSERSLKRLLEDYCS